MTYNDYTILGTYLPYVRYILHSFIYMYCILNFYTYYTQKVYFLLKESKIVFQLGQIYLEKNKLLLLCSEWMGGWRKRNWTEIKSMTLKTCLRTQFVTKLLFSWVDLIHFENILVPIKYQFVNWLNGSNDIIC